MLKSGLLAALFARTSAQDLFLAPHQSVNGTVNADLAPDCGMSFEVASHTLSNQGKFAVWHEALQAIFYVDSPAFTPAWSGSIVYAYTPSVGKLHEVYRCDTCTIGSVMPRKMGGIVLAMSFKDGLGYNSSVEVMDVDAQTFVGGALQKIVDIPRATKGKFNNGNCDPYGRLFLGTFEYGNEWKKEGKVWIVERKRGHIELRVGIDQIGHPNGLVWNQAGTELLFSRTYANEVLRYKYTLATGALSDPEQVVRATPSADLFDSICGFEDGSFLVTEPGFWRLKHFNADGTLKCIQNLPGQSHHNFVASCAFGKGDLYVPTGRNGWDGNPPGPDGWLFRVKNVAGGMVSHDCDI